MLKYDRQKNSIWSQINKANRDIILNQKYITKIPYNIPIPIIHKTRRKTKKQNI